MKNKFQFPALFTRFVVITALLAFLPITSYAGFPDDFSDVTWIDPNISSWPVTAQISVNVRGSTLAVNDTKKDVWPRRFHTTLRNDCCNRSLWIIIKYEGRWYASTFEYMRVGQVNKNAEAVNGRQIKRAPFLRPGFLWRPAKGEVYGFITSGMARFDLNNLNVRERSNVALYRWEVGPTDNVEFEEVPRDSTGRPIEDDGGVEECVEPPTPTPAVNTHIYNGTATGQLVVSGANNQSADFREDVTIRVSDNRSVTFNIDDESFSSQVATDGSFGGKFTFDIGNAGICVVDINVSGNINGTRASGSASGSDACAGNTATFNATFSATSATAPSYLDQRPPLQTPRSVCGKTQLAPIFTLLLEEG